MIHQVPTNDFDDLISAPIGGGRGHIPVDVGFDENLLAFENQDLSTMNWGDEEYAGVHAPEVPVETVAKESTGRWTREEHLAFIKGLELYGKGWKKIASLIKTRTVVQIRTHAQKYFLKLSKARQNGEHHLTNGAGRNSVEAARKRRERKSDRPLAICPALKHYFQKDSRGTSPTVSPEGSIACGDDNMSSTNGQGNDNASVDSGDVSNASTGADTNNKQASISTTSSASTTTTGASNSAVIVSMKDELLDAETGLFNFLSPVLNGDDGSNTVSDTNSVNSGYSNNSGSASASALAPAWYAKGGHLQSLLRDAEGLDWAADRGVPQVESAVNTQKPPNPIYSQQNLITQGPVPSSGGVLGTVTADATTTSTAPPVQEGAAQRAAAEDVKPTFYPWNLVQQQKRFLDEAATNMPGAGDVAYAKVNTTTVSASASNKRGANDEEVMISSNKRPKVETSAAMQQPQMTASPLTVASLQASSAASSDAARTSMATGATAPVNAAVVEHMLSNQLLMQKQIDKLNGQLADRTQGQGQDEGLNQAKKVV